MSYSTGWNCPTAVRVARVVLGACLLTAAVLKGGTRQDLTLLPDAAPAVPWQVGVACDLLLAVCLTLDAVSRCWRALTVGCFGLFTAWSLTAAVAGRASCGCFGTASIPPWVTLIVDCMVAVGAAWLARGWVLLAGAGTLAAVTAYAVGEQLVQKGGPIQPPAEWLGEPAPFLEPARGQPDGDSLGRGEWLVVLWRPGCQRCRDTLRDFAGWSASDGVRFATVQLGPDAVPDDETGDHSEVVRVTIPDPRWSRLPVPVIVRLTDGTVVAVDWNHGR
jgi:hypothetical protein